MSDDRDWRLHRSSGYKLIKDWDYTGHMEQGRRTAYYEGFKRAKEFYEVNEEWGDEYTDSSDTGC